MRLVVFGVLLLVLFGCVAVEEPAEEAEENITEEPEIPEEIPEEVPEENETAEPEINESEESGINELELNETINESMNWTEEIIANETVNETMDESGEIDGILFGEGKYLLILDDAVWYGGRACAAIDITYVNGTSIKRDVICPTQDYYWIAPDRHKFRIKVVEVAAGYSGEAWADISIYG